MKERPILFSAPMVRAILEGRKTQTRRVVKSPIVLDWLDQAKFDTAFVAHPDNDMCKLGKIGDRLWVKETHAMVFEVDIPQGRAVGPLGTMGCPAHPDWKSRYVYRADGEMPKVQWHHAGDCQPVRWTPSIFMPRRASRIALEIINVRVERLNEISEHDSVAEGINCFQFRPDDGYPICDGYTHHPDDGKIGLHSTAKGAYRELWESINGAGSWDKNPWVWVIEFKRVQEAE